MKVVGAVLLVLVAIGLAQYNIELRRKANARRSHCVALIREQDAAELGANTHHGTIRIADAIAAVDNEHHSKAELDSFEKRYYQALESSMRFKACVVSAE